MPLSYSISEFTKACGGELLQHKHDEPVEYLLTDSRKLTFSKSTAFFALETSRNDGHNFISELYQKGVRNFVVEKQIEQASFPEATFKVVENAIVELQRTAKEHRKSFNIPTIGITGSNGKTIVKEWLSEMLGFQQTLFFC